MKTIKLKDEDFKLLKEQEIKIYELQQTLGSITFQKLILQEAEMDVAQQIAELLNKEEEISKLYLKEHGEGQIDLNKGEFTTLK